MKRALKINFNIIFNGWVLNGRVQSEGRGSGVTTPNGIRQRGSKMNILNKLTFPTLKKIRIIERNKREFKKFSVIFFFLKIP